MTMTGPANAATHLPQSPNWLAGGGEMGERIRAMDWSQTPLGPFDRWPQSLRSAVSILLPSKAQIVLFWGPDLIAIYNDAYRPVFGAKHPKALGLPVREAWSEIWETGLRALFEGVLTTGEAFWASDRLFILERYGFPEETFFDVSYDPIRDESGQVGGLFCIVSETTARVVSERRLRTLREISMLSTAETSSVDEACRAAAQILEGNPEDLPFVLLYLVEPGGKSAKLAGVSGLEAGTHAAPHRLDLTAPDRDGLQWPFRSVLNSKGKHVVVDVISRFGALPGGVWPEPPKQAVVLPIGNLAIDRPGAFLVAGASPRRPLDEQYRAFFELLAAHVGTTITNARAYEEERRRAETLAQLDRAKTAFFSSVSHEFRTPLTLMMGPLEDALGEADLPDLTRERLTLAHHNSMRLLKLVNTLLDFSRIEAGRFEISYEPVNLATLTAELADVFRSTVERAGMRLVVDCPPLSGPVYVDCEMWEKVVFNLLSNAFKFTLEGDIAVSLRQVDNAVELTVQDTGTGIPPEELPHLFDRFHRVKGARGRSYEGSGIGLALVQELVKMHGGHVRVQSQLDRGTTFTVTIPMGTAHLPPDRIGTHPERISTGLFAEVFIEETMRWSPEEGESSSPEPETVARPTSETLPNRLESLGAGERILLADDNADMRRYLRRLLQGYKVRSVSDGRAALAAAREQTPDLVLTDVMMPGLDGFELLREIRQDPRLRQVPVILLSARAGEESRIEGLAAGADDYLVKPFNGRELLARVRAHLDLIKLRRDALKEADRRKDEFLAMLAHELRNPLAPIRNAVQILRNQSGQGADLQWVTEVIDRQGQQLTRLVDDLLDISRITRGIVVLRKESVDLADIVKSAVEASRPSIEKQEHALTVSLPSQPVKLKADSARLTQVFLNLLQNAAKYTDPGGRIELIADLDGDHVLVRVKDNGIGITPDMLPRIFDLFAQVDWSTERSDGGLGIGLTLVERLVALHGGSVSARSEGPGLGSEFLVRLPLALEAADTELGQISQDPTSQPSARRILIVDDNRDAADSLAILLRMTGHDVHAVHDGLAAVETATEFKPEIVLLDIGLPKMSGIEVARHIRERENGRRTLLVAMTGWGQKEDHRRSREAGFDHHLTKPVEFSTLMKLFAGDRVVERE